MLISADRDPQPSWPGVSNKGRFYGPSILSAPLSALSSLDKTFFRPGRSGPSQAASDIPYHRCSYLYPIQHRHSPSKQLEFLSHGLTHKEAHSVISAMWKIFDQHEGLWFSFTLSPSSNGLKIISPYLEFDDFAVRRQALLKPYFDSLLVTPTLPVPKTADCSTSNCPTSRLQLLQPQRARSCQRETSDASATAQATPWPPWTVLNVAGGRPANFLDGGGGRIGSMQSWR